MSSESQVRAAAKLYEIRDVMRRLLGDRYAEAIAPWKDYIRRGMVGQNMDNVLIDTLRIAEAMKANGEDIPPMFLAAAVELVEPTEAEGG